MTSKFFCLTHWQQQLLVFLSMLLLFLFGYFYFVNDLKKLTQQQKETYQKSVEKIKLIELQLHKYSNKPILPLNLISENKLAQLLLSHKLILQKFHYNKTDDASRWDISFQGSYFDFVALINTFINNYYYLDLQNVSITKKNNKQLLFELRLCVKKR